MKRIEVKPESRFHDLAVIREVEATSVGATSKRRQFLCKCQCGNETEVRLDHLRVGHTTSCGRCGILYNGKKKTLTAWAKSIGVNESTLRARLKVMSLGEALLRGNTK